MSSSSVNSSDGRSPTVEQVLGECFVRVAQTVLTSRVYEGNNVPTSERSAKRSTWFKLELEELQSARPALERWRGERGIGLPLVLEIYLQPWGVHASPTTAAAGVAASATLVERWMLRLGPSTTLPLPPGGGLTRSQMMRLNPQGIYKRLTIMLRSLYSYVRVMPAYRLYRATCRQRGATFCLAYKLHSTLPSRSDTAAAATGNAYPRRMQRFDFTPVDTADGQLSLGVEYQPASTVRVLEQTASPPPRTQIIYDYVGGRGAAQQQQQERRAPGEALPRGSPLSPALAALDATPRRRNWSSGFRNAYSPRLSPAAPSSGSPSPASSPHALPPFSFPRSLSMPQRTAAAVPAGRPPLPPGAAAGSPTPRQALSPPPAALVDAQEGSSEGESEEETTSPSSGRQTTAPMRIPGRAGGHPSRRMRSSGDLGALQGEGRAQAKPLSAPAVSNLQQDLLPPSAVSVVPNPTDPPSAATGPSLPASPLLPPASAGAARSGASSSGSGASFSALPFPASSSPDLPFAFTPNARSNLFPRSVHTPGTTPPLLERASPQGPSRGTIPPRPVSQPSASPPPERREGQRSLALVRHTSWGSRSLSAGGSLPIGYSVSPLQDPVLESMLSGSMPRQHSVAGAGLERSVSGGRGTERSATRVHYLHHYQHAHHHAHHQQQPALLTFPSREQPAQGAARDRVVESEPMAFAYAVGEAVRPLDRRHLRPLHDGSQQGPAQRSDSSGSSSQDLCAEEGSASREDAARLAAAADSSSSAAAVGAFVRLVQAAAPLAGADSVPLEDGLLALKGLRARLLARAGGGE